MVCPVGGRSHKNLKEKAEHPAESYSLTVESWRSITPMKKKKIILVLASAIVVSALVTLGVGGTLFLRDRRIDAAGHQMFSCIVDGNAEQLWSLMTPKMQQSFASRHGGHEGALRHIRASSGTWDDLVGFSVVWRLVFGDEATVTIQTE